MKEFVGMKKYAFPILFLLVFAFEFFLIAPTRKQALAKTNDWGSEMVFCSDGTSSSSSDGLIQDIMSWWRDLGEELEAIDMRRLVLGIIMDIPTSASSYVVFGKELDKLNWCTAAQMLRKGDACIVGGTCSVNQLPVSSSCAMDDDVYIQNCSDLDKEADTIGYINNPRHVRYLNNGLIGFVDKLQIYADAYETPANLAFYVNKQVERIPFFGTALAQGTTYRNQIFLDITYRVWQVFKNVALGIMAVVILAVGIMIITRKQISPQAVVTIQTALPRIVIAIILIVFSYPIGAVLSSMSLGLNTTFTDVVSRFTSNPNPDFYYYVRSVIIVLVNILSGGFMFFFVFGIISAVIISVAALLMLVKMYTLYIQILVLIVTGPLNFAVGAIPSYEKQTIKWFKTILAKVLAIPMMKAVFSLSIAVSAEVFKTIMGFDGSGFNFGADIFRVAVSSFNVGAVIICWICIIILLGGLLYARKIPTKIEDLIMGEDAPSKKRK